jgi:hypothetical protein
VASYRWTIIDPDPARCSVLDATHCTVASAPDSTEHTMKKLIVI